MRGRGFGLMLVPPSVLLCPQCREFFTVELTIFVSVGGIEYLLCMVRVLAACDELRL